MLAEIRKQGGLVERSPGVFYRKGRAFLHFHEDPSGLHADLRPGAEWERFRVETAAERRAFSLPCRAAGGFALQRSRRRPSSAVVLLPRLAAVAPGAIAGGQPTASARSGSGSSMPHIFSRL